jgi:hypothetical protein
MNKVDMYQFGKYEKQEYIEKQKEHAAGKHGFVKKQAQFPHDVVVFAPCRLLGYLGNEVQIEMRLILCSLT